MIIIINKRRILYLFLVLLIVVATIRLNASCIRTIMQVIEIPKKTIVIDAGHGGRDPGAISKNGTPEKDINLAIAKKVKFLLEKNNFNVIMTREEDISLYDEGSENRHLSDISNRIKIVNESNTMFFVSFHLNSFEQNKYYGSQVFYHPDSSIGKQLAEVLQKQLIEKVDTSNSRVAKPLDTVLLLRKTKIPGVIVECGFLSNPKEEELLKTDQYQQKIAEAVVEGIKLFLDGQSKIENSVN